MAEELNRLIDACMADRLDLEASAELKRFLWDNKVGMLRALQMLAVGETEGKS